MTSPSAQANTAAETPSHCMTNSERLTEPRKEPSVDQYSAMPLASPVRAFHQIGQDRHGLAEQPGQRAEHAADEKQVGNEYRLQMGEHPVHRNAGQPDAGQHR
jgi:hypothetical protein